MNLPNKLTLARIIAVPFFIWTYTSHYLWASVIIFALASLTDMADGKIARKYNLVTNFGKIMDPLADKILVYSAFCLMVGDRTIQAWTLIIILFREFLVAGVRTVAASTGTVIAADMAGKMSSPCRCPMGRSMTKRSGRRWPFHSIMAWSISFWI